MDVNIMAALPEDILTRIAKKLDVVGLHCFSAVCRSWQSIAIAEKKKRRLLLPPQLPWLMLSSLEDKHPGFFSLYHGKVFRFELPEVYGARCYGSNWGWLIMVGKMGRNFLLNPFTRILIELPPQATLPALGNPPEQSDNYITKAMLLSPPPAATITNNSDLDDKMLLSPPPAATITNNSDLDNKNIVSSVATNDCVIIAIYFLGNLAFCRPGDEAWTALDREEEFEDIISWEQFEDIIFYNGKLYSITEECNLVLMELGPHPKVTSCNIDPPTEEDDLSLPTDLSTAPLEEDLGIPTDLSKSFYLVECLGELLMVIKCCIRVSFAIYRTVMLKVFKLDQKGQNWVKVEDLGDQMIFIGTSTALSVSGHDYPGFRRNCIYFTDYDGYSLLEFKAPGTVARLFHLEDNRIEPFFSNDPDSTLYPPIWFTPIS